MGHAARNFYNSRGGGAGRVVKISFIPLICREKDEISRKAAHHIL